MLYFLNCRIRVDHVTCDSQAWPTCDPRAIALKTKFECHLLPVRCHDVNEDEISKVCPADCEYFDCYFTELPQMIYILGLVDYVRHGVKLFDFFYSSSKATYMRR